MFAADRDLLIYEPHLFRDLAWAGQTLASGEATLVGSTMEISTDPSLEERGIGPGHVVMIDQIAYEILERIGSSEVIASLLRVATGDPVIPPPKMTARPAYISTFAPQIALAHRHVLRLLGIDPDDPAAGGATASQVTNPRDLMRLEALGALHLIYAAAAAAHGDEGPFAQRAAMYQRRFADERGRAMALLDLDHDGVADAVRRPAVAYLTRG
ncbi:MAG: hypothetical protein HBSAPP03_04960 [Phycisphaerae bacterium]|nr:MAG: hypothetical protein HBSAPP03_04960 [Phycisphaerae bacterium]